METPDTTADHSPGREAGPGGLRARVGGVGEPLVLLHGWSMNSAAWEPVLPALEADYAVHRVDLPGHGFNADMMPGADADGWIEAVAAAAPERAVWLGWSLGGMLALAVADRFPEKVARLVLVATNPRFVESADWPSGVQRSVWDTFIEAFRGDPDGALRQFTRLQGLGCDSPVKQGRALERLRARGGEPARPGLAAGLSILESLDLRETLTRLSVPVQAILGAGDALVPDSVAAALAALNPRVDVATIPAAGHAPFVARPEWFLEVFKGAAS